MLSSFFKDRRDYVILKMSDHFPAYAMGSDIDILCRDKIKFAEHVQKVALRRLDPDTVVKARGTHLQVDIMRRGKLVVKFDLVDSTKEYGLDSDDIFKKRLRVFRCGLPYNVPCIGHELQIRGVEYRKNKNKTWHRDYIEKHGALGLFPDLEPRIKA